MKQNLMLMPLLWSASYLMTAKLGLRQVQKINMYNIKPPYLVLATHQGFSDYFIAPRALFPHRANYISDVEGFAGYGKWFYRQGGCIAKRRYVPDITVMNHIRYALFTLKQNVVLFPESRHCDAGVTSTLPDNLGKLVKLLNVPVVMLTAQGSYLANPFWDESHTRKSKLTACLRLLHTPDELQMLSAEALQQEITQALQYDEYQYQLTHKIFITYPKRAEGLHLPLYQCIVCKIEGCMDSHGTKLYCRHCNATWELNESGQLVAQDNTLVHIPDWYRWERSQTAQQVLFGKYQLDLPVSIEALPNEKGFVKLGTGRLYYHPQSGFRLSLDKHTIKLYDNFPLQISSKSLSSCQTEYHYRSHGKCIVLSTQNCCYYIYSNHPDFLVTKLEFATEIAYRKIFSK